VILANADIIIVIGVAYLAGLLTSLGATLVVLRDARRSQPVRRPTLYGQRCADVVAAALADETLLPVVAGHGQEAPPDTAPDGVPPLVVEGPPSGHGTSPSGMPILRVPSCSRCLDEGAMGGCRWCDASPRMVRPFAQPRHANGGRS
jgi:hypothetical protein